MHFTEKISETYHLGRDATGHATYATRETSGHHVGWRIFCSQSDPKAPRQSVGLLTDDQLEMLAQLGKQSRFRPLV
jgi:hypothetical protein